MITPKQEVLEAIVRLKTTSDFMIITAWMRDSLIAQSIDNNNTRDDVVNRQNQGRNLELHEQLKQIEKAKENLDRMKEKPKSLV